MKDKIVQLDDDRNYVILDSVNTGDRVFYYALRLDSNDEPTNNYLFFEEFKDGEDIFLDPVTDDSLKDMLFGAFTLNFVDIMYDA